MLFCFYLLLLVPRDDRYEEQSARQCRGADCVGAGGDRCDRRCLYVCQKHEPRFARKVHLSEVYYIVTQNNPETKQNSNVLVKRGKELHEPDRMYLNPNQILCVEPVGEKSKVAQLIAQAH